MPGALNRILALLITLLFTGWLPAQADQATVWDMTALGRFDPTNKAYDIIDGRVTVDLISGSSLCPTGLGHLASGMTPVREILIRYEIQSPADCWLHVTWNPGGSGKEQFEVFANDQPVGKTDLVDAAAAPEQDVRSSFKIPQRKGANELLLHVLSGDGLRFRSLALTTGPLPPGLAFTGTDLKPTLEFPTLDSYSAAVGEPAVMLDREHVRLFAPKTRAREAETITDYLVRAYDELHKITGIHTQYKIVVYHFPENSPNARGGTSVCPIWYGYDNLALEKQSEWTRYKVPHVSGYIEEMAHNFVDAAKVNFGWEMTGWSIGVLASAAVADNPIFQRQIRDTRAQQARTYQRYRSLRNTFPRDVKPNLADRIHAHLLWQCAQQYGPTFWPDFFAEAAKERQTLYDAVRLSDGDAVRNERYRISVDCFDRLPNLRFKQRLAANGISTTTAIQSLHPESPSWNRKFE